MQRHYNTEPKMCRMYYDKMNVKSLQFQTTICDWPSQCVPEYPSRQEQLNPCSVVLHVPLFRHGESEQGVTKIMKNKKAYNSYNYIPYCILYSGCQHAGTIYISPTAFVAVRVAHLFSVLCNLCLASPMLQVSLDCPVLIAATVFSNVYIH